MSRGLNRGAGNALVTAGALDPKLVDDGSALFATPTRDDEDPPSENFGKHCPSPRLEELADPTTNFGFGLAFGNMMECSTTSTRSGLSDDSTSSGFWSAPIDSAN